MTIPIVTPMTIAAPPRNAILTPRHTIGRREKRALTTPTMNNETTERMIDTVSAVLEVNIMYGTRGMRDASTQETNIKIAEIIEGLSFTFE